MYREVLNTLSEWKEKENRKPLLLKGAKGVGKSYTLKDFGMGYFENSAIFDFKEQEYVKSLFVREKDPEKIIKMLGVTSGENMIPGETFLAFENVDFLPEAEEIIKFITDNMSEYHIALTISVNEEEYLSKEIIQRFEIIGMYPLNFSEFLIVNKESKLSEAIKEIGRQPLTEEELEKVQEYLKLYMIIGGMPKVVQVYVNTQDMVEVETAKSKLIMGLMNQIDAIEDVTLKGKVSQIWNSLSAQLEKDNKKFQYGAVKLTARAREYEEGLKWLIYHKYVHLLYKMKDEKSSTTGEFNNKSFRVFYNDIGIMSSVMGVTDTDIDVNNIQKLHNGALALQLVFGELNSNKNIQNMCYWNSEGLSKIDFLFKDQKRMVPVVLDLSNNKKAQSIKVYKDTFKPPMIIKVTSWQMDIKESTLGIPVYSLWNL